MASNKKIDGMLFKEMFVSGAALLNKNRENVDALNVSWPLLKHATKTNSRAWSIARHSVTM